MTDKPIDAVVCWLGAGVFCIVMFRTLRSGEFRWFQGPLVSRADSPGEYWLWTAIFCAGTCLLLLMALANTIMAVK
jgi:hypothetical protein